MRAARLRAALASALAACSLACVAPGLDPDAPDLDWLRWTLAAYRAESCALVRDEVRQAELRYPAEVPFARLLAAHCDELEREFSRARAAYEAIVRDAPASEAAQAARARLHEFARMDEGFARAVVVDRARSAPPIPADRRPSPVSRGVLRYPDWLLRGEATGWVVVEMTLDAAGVPRDLAVLESWPPFLFESAALNVVSESRYAPPPARHDPRRTWYVAVEFRIE